MDKMPNHPRLYRRGAVYWHRAAIPLDIKSTYPKTEETFSLKTRDYHEALRLVRVAAAEVDARFAAHRDRVARGQRPSLAELSDEQIGLIGMAYYTHLLEEDEETRLDGFYETDAPPPALPVPSFEEYEEAVSDLAVDAKHGYARGKPDAFFQDEAREVLGWDNVNLNLAEKSPSWPRIVRALQTATIKATADIALRNSGEVVETPRQTSKVGVRSRAPLLSEASDRWLKEKSRNWVPKTLSEHRAWMREFLALAGDRPIDTYRKDDASAFKSALLRLPPNWSKQKSLRGLSLLQASERAAEQSMTPMSTTNINKILRFVGAFWIWAANHFDSIPHDLFKGLQVRERTRDIREERHPFSAAELHRIFRAPLYTGCLSSRRWTLVGQTFLREAGIYWVPLLGLFTGSRSGEIIQMNVADVRSESGILFLDVNLEGDAKRLKNVRSKRRIPVHSELLRIGFGELVELRRRQGETRLFPDMPLGHDGYYSSPYSKHFRRFLASIGVKHGKNAFHSFRHNFEDACRNSGVLLCASGESTGYRGGNQ